MMFCNFLMIYIFWQHILPVCQRAVAHFDNSEKFDILMDILAISIPAAYFWIVGFYAFFHTWMNIWAELTRFGDRRFYSDWWNASNLGEYWRKWNHPIHNWLIRHVYYPLIRRRVKASHARFAAFFISAVFHEYIVIGGCRVINFIAFTMMILNVPIIQFQIQFRHYIKPRLNNSLFWLGYTIIGQPTCVLIIYYQIIKKETTLIVISDKSIDVEVDHLLTNKTMSALM